MRSGYAPAVCFSAGVLTALAAVFMAAPWLHLLAGPCFVLTGALGLWGLANTLHSPLGGILATLIGSPRVRFAKLRMWMWIVFGIGLTALGARALYHPREPPTDVPPPKIASAATAPTRSLSMHTR